MKLSEALTAIQGVAGKFTDAPVESFHFSLKAGDGMLVSFYKEQVALNPPTINQAMQQTVENAPAGEAKPSGKKNTKPASTSKPGESSSGASAETAQEKGKPASGGASTASETASSSDDDDLFGQTSDAQVANEKETPVPSKDDMRLWLVKVQSDVDKDTAMKILNKHTPEGTHVLSGVKESDRQKVIDECKAALAKKAK